MCQVADMICVAVGMVDGLSEGRGFVCNVFARCNRTFSLERIRPMREVICNISPHWMRPLKRAPIKQTQPDDSIVVMFQRLGRCWLLVVPVLPTIRRHICAVMVTWSVMALTWVAVAPGPSTTARPSVLTTKTRALWSSPPPCVEVILMTPSHRFAATVGRLGRLCYHSAPFRWFRKT